MATTAQPEIDVHARVEALVERMFTSLTAAMDLAVVDLGDRLGLYAALAGEGPCSSGRLAIATGTDERYVREWLEHQAVGQLIEVDDPDAGATERRYSLPAGLEQAFTDPEFPGYVIPFGRFAVAAAEPIERLVEAFRTGAGVPYADYGARTHDSIAAFNRPSFRHELAGWIASVPDVDRRLRTDPRPRVADIGCGQGWSTIALAQAYPNALVDGFDIDAGSIEKARAHAAAVGLSERVRFVCQDAADPGLDGHYALVTLFETLHDMAHPVGALETARRLTDEGGAVIIADMRAAERFEPSGDPVERLLYGASVLHCLAVGRCEHGSHETGAVMRPATLDAYAREAGFAGAEVLPIENVVWRFYRLNG